MSTTNDGRLTVSKEPFIKTREVTICVAFADYWNGMSPELKDRYFIPRWSQQRIRQHLEMLKAFGFNAIQTSAAGQYAMGAGVDESVWEAKLILEMRMAREMGMEVTFIKWGSHFYDDAKRSWVGDLDWHNPSDRAFMEKEYRHQARFAPYVDRVVTHWIDPGGPKKGCAECSIETAIEMHNRILDLFRQENPNLDGYFSTWAMLWPGWPHWRGYEGVRSVAQSRTLDRNSGIALESHNIDSDGLVLGSGARLNTADVDTITKSGRKVGVWCWYTADIEIQPSLHVHTALLERYFRGLQQEARNGLDWHTLDDTSFGLNMHNLFVAGRLMQDPSLDSRQLLNEFVTGLVGDRAAGAVVAGLDALEQARCRSLRYGAEIAEIPGVGAPPPNPTKKPRAGASWTMVPVLDASWLTDTAKKVQDAISRLNPLSVDPGRATAWPVTMSPADYVEELKAHLRAVDQMMAFLHGSWKIQQRAASGGGPEELEAAVNALPKVVYDPAHTAGLEEVIYKHNLASLKQKHCRWMNDATASPLLPAAKDIRSVPLPDANLEFSPVPFVAELQFVDIRSVHGGDKDGLVYVRGTLDRLRDGKGRLLYGADGPVKVWVNGTAVGCEPRTTNPAVVDQYSAAVAWKKGRNEILFAICTNAGKAWGVMARAVLE